MLWPDAGTGLGGATEFTPAIRMARSNRIGVPISLSTSAASQVAMLVAPVLVIVSWLLSGGEPLSLAFLPVEVLSIVLAVLTVSQIAHHGEGNWLGGVQLLTVYLILSTLFYFH